MDSLIPVLLSGFWLISALNYFGVQIASDLGQQKSLQTSSCVLLACLHILWAHLSSSKHADMYQFSLVAQSCLTLCNSMDCSAPAFPVHHQLQSLLRLKSIESVMPSNHLILCHPLFLLPSIFPSIRAFSNESAVRIRWPINMHYISIMYSWNLEFTPSSNPKFRVYSGFLPFLICNSFLWRSEAGSHYPLWYV